MNYLSLSPIILWVVCFLFSRPCKKQSKCDITNSNNSNVLSGPYCFLSTSLLQPLPQSTLPSLIPSTSPVMGGVRCADRVPWLPDSETSTSLKGKILICLRTARHLTSQSFCFLSEARFLCVWFAMASLDYLQIVRHSARLTKLIRPATDGSFETFLSS